jgi:GNAT superfamily N-acetyltransferase
MLLHELGIYTLLQQERGASVAQIVEVAFFLRNPDGTVVGGIYGITFWGCLSVELLWVEEHLRGRGYGERLLAAAEQEAIRRGCSHAFLDTFDFQAPSFYTRRGYEIFGKLANLPPVTSDTT